MSLQTSRNDVDVQVTRGDGPVTATIQDARDSTQALFERLDEEQAQALARDAWSIGLKALRNAAAEAEESRLTDVGKSLLDDVEKQLATHLKVQEEKVQGVLQAYFDPRDGKVTERLQNFVKDDGDLARLFADFADPETGRMARTLAERLGEQSPLFKRLDPRDAEGVVQQLQKRFEEALGQNKEHIRRAMDPAADDSPVRNFLTNLQEELKKHDADRESQLKGLTKALDANDPQSLISQLRTNVEKSNSDLLRALDLGNEKSPLASIRNTLTVMIRGEMDKQKELLEGQEKRQIDFEKRVHEALTRLQTQKEDAERTTHGGLEYEDLVSRFVEDAVGHGMYLHEATGNRTGFIPNCKKGDHVVSFASDHAFHGSNVVIEVKRDRSYNVPAALEELDEAKRNRGSDAGVFVMKASHAPAGFPRFSRYGNDILVQWDPERSETDAYLHAALMAALCLATRKRREVDDTEIEAVAAIEGKLLKEVQRHEKMDGMANRIQSNAEKLLKELDVGKRKIQGVIRDARTTLEALNIEARDLEEERASPIGLDDSSFVRARDRVRPPADPVVGANGHSDDQSEDPATAWRRHVSIEAPSVTAFRVDRRPPGDADEEATEEEEEEEADL